MKTPVATKLLVTFILALAIHLILGWAWTILAGIAVGAWAVQRGWLLGGGGVGLSWLVLILYNMIIAPGPVGRMTETFGGILGNLPGFSIIAITLLIGVLLGTVGGGLGTQIRRLSTQRSSIPSS